MKKLCKTILPLICVLMLMFALTPASLAECNTLKRGCCGDAVKQLQGNLIYLGYLDGTADGIYGTRTENAVKCYQRANSLTADGVYGLRTRACLTSEVLRVIKVITTAKGLTGTEYTYGGTSPSTGFDCSGFTQYVFSKAGISIPRVSSDQAGCGTGVSRSCLRPGDLVCFNSPVSHVGIYVGDGMFIHSPHTGDCVKLTALKYMDLTAIRRCTGPVY